MKIFFNARALAQGIVDHAFCEELAVVANLMGLTATLSRGLQEPSQHIEDAMARVREFMVV